MQWSEIQANWHLVKGHVIKKWGQLTDDELTELNGEFEQFIGLLQKKLKVDRDVAEFQVNEFQSSLNETAVLSRDVFVEHLTERLERANERLLRLKEKVESATADVQDSIENELEIASDRYQLTANRLAELRSSSGDAWKDLADGCHKSWQQLKAACDSAWNRFESSS